MPQIIITEEAMRGLQSCQLFLREKNPRASVRASQAIKKSLSSLQADPEIGRPIEDLPELRELIIPFGDSGYIALYHYEKQNNFLYILAFRHQKEVSY